MGQRRNRPVSDEEDGRPGVPAAEAVERVLSRMFEASVPGPRRGKKNVPAETGRALKRPDEIGRAGRKSD